MIYPVGSIYLSVNSANPSTLFGGIWERIKDTFLLASGDTYTAGSAGGKEKVRLSAAIGAYNNDAYSLGYLEEGPSVYQQNHAGAYAVQGQSFISPAGSANHSTAVTEHGSNDRDVTIMPPYLVVYVWKRTG